VITKEFGELMSRKNTELSASQLANTPAITLPATSKINDLLAAADPAKSSIGGRWETANGIWTSPESPQAGIGLTAELPPEFDLVVEVERIAGQGELAIAVPCQEQKVLFIVDYGGSKSGIAGVREGLYTSPVLSTNSPVSLSVRVRKDVFAVSANGREVYAHAASGGLPAAPGSWQIPSTANLFVGARNARFRIYGSWILTPGKSVVRADLASRPKSADLASRPPRPSRSEAVKRDDENKVSSRKANAQVVELRQVASHSWNNVASLAFSPDNRFLAIGGLSGQFQVIEWTKKRIAMENRGFSSGDMHFAFTPSGDKLLGPGSGGKVDIWDVAGDGSLKQSPKAFLGHTDHVEILDISRDGKFAITGCRDKRIRYWNIETCRESLVFEGFKHEIAKIRFAPDGSKALATDGAKVYTLDLMSGDATQSMIVHSYPHRDALAFSGSGRLLAIRGNVSEERLFDIGSGKELATLGDDTSGEESVFSPDESLLFVGKASVAAWDVVAQQRVALWDRDGQNLISALAMSPDGRYLAAGSGQTAYVLEIHRPDSNPAK
jgi:WD domain, G-beta repeat